MATRRRRGDTSEKRKFSRCVGTAIHQRCKYVGSGGIAHQRGCRGHVNCNRHWRTVAHYVHGTLRLKPKQLSDPRAHYNFRTSAVSNLGNSPVRISLSIEQHQETAMYTLFLKYTIDPNKLADWRAYAEAEGTPITESGGRITGYYAPTEFAGATSEAFATIDVGTMAEYEVYRGKLAAHPKHQENARKIEASGAIHSIYRAIIQKVDTTGDSK
jgi:hypothetical protein